MPRVGRGGGGRGRGRGRPKYPWEDDHDVKPDNTPSQLFPPITQNFTNPVTTQERRQISHYRTFRSRVHEGPLYTVLGESSRTAMRGVSAAANIDPFEGMPTYSQKYQRKVRKIPKLDTRPYVLKLFPQELWSTLDPDHDVQDGTAVPSKKRKTLQFSTTQDSITLLEDAVVPSGSNTEDQSRPDRRIQSKAAGDSGKVEDEDDEELRHDDEDEPPDEEPDEDENYEEDEVEMGGDYDAEHYFNDGGEDDGEYYDGGGDDDGGVM